MSMRTFYTIVFAVSAFILIAVFLTPMAYGYGTFMHLDGSSGSMDHDWSKYGIGAFIYALGDIFCHQMMDRCFIINGSQTAFCIRDIGILIGLTIGCLICIKKYDIVNNKRAVLVCLVLVLLSLFEWIFEKYVSFDMSGVRFIAAILSGIGAVVVVGWVIEKCVKGEVPPQRV